MIPTLKPFVSPLERAVLLDVRRHPASSAADRRRRLGLVGADIEGTVDSLHDKELLGWRETSIAGRPVVLSRLTVLGRKTADSLAPPDGGARRRFRFPGRLRCPVGGVMWFERSVGRWEGVPGVLTNSDGVSALVDLDSSDALVVGRLFGGAQVRIGLELPAGLGPLRCDAKAVYAEATKPRAKGKLVVRVGFRLEGLDPEAKKALMSLARPTRAGTCGPQMSRPSGRAARLMNRPSGAGGRSSP